eukprot:TRINITY_DN63144_c0_g2_i2.p1 TRINITY_DN63144_c0_g2~~TRINITY_DN63144_c0_g2_i2.p1  ORF type:complete len:334 (+),score=18.45 TRINITY_DN63144_c0_g2_i2:52-1053(+)
MLKQSVLRATGRSHVRYFTHNNKTYSNNTKGMAEFIKSSSCKNIAFLTGAGISVASGIPDFRSPGGMYDTLRPELLTATKMERHTMAEDPTAVVSWDLFRNNQLPYLELRRPFILSSWKPTLGHWFVRAVEDAGKLTRLYTQNIDGLHYQCGLNEDKIIAVHGTMATVSCEGCKAAYPIDEFKEVLQKNIRDIYNPENGPKESTGIPCKACGQRLVKPDTVLFGRSLPENFFSSAQEDLPSLDLLVILGTSLEVSPANSLVPYANQNCVRFVVNSTQVGQAWLDYSGKPDGRDLWDSRSIDTVLWELAGELGWDDAMLKYSEHWADASKALLK